MQSNCKEVRMLTKEECLFERDEKGELIGKVVTLDMLPNKPEIKIKPLIRGELVKLHEESKSETSEKRLETDNKIVLSGLVEPKITEEELRVMKPQYVTAISIAIVAASLGVTQEKVKKDAESVLLQEELVVKK